MDLMLEVWFCIDQAKRTLLMKHEAETKSNAYWLGLIAHLQAASVGRKVRENITLRDWINYSITLLNNLYPV